MSTNRKKLKDLTTAETTEILQLLARGIQNHTTLMGLDKPFFTLMLFNDPTAVQFVSNGDSASQIRALRHLADQLEQREIKRGERLLG